MREMKPKWPRVKFGEVVRQVKERADPETSDLERFIAGEHMDTDDLKIHRWGNVGDGYLGPAFHMRFRPGQVLYGSRRTYLRKVALADFEGICANTTFVLESADPQTLLPELLPFIMQSEGFHEHSKRESKGSVNPYVNFSDIAWYEFSLPPLEQQHRLAQTLSAFESTRQAFTQLERETQAALDSLAQWYATAGLQPLDSRGIVETTCLPLDWRFASIREICSGDGAGLTLGPFGSSLTVDDYGYLTEGTPVLFVADVHRYVLRHDSGRFISRAKHEELAAHEALPGDVLVTEMGWPPGETCVVPEGWPASIIKADIIRARLNRKYMLPEYLAIVLNSHWGQQQIVRISPGTTRPRTTLRDFERLILAVPKLEVQCEAIQQIAHLQSAILSIRQQLKVLGSAKFAFMDEIWGTP